MSLLDPFGLSPQISWSAIGHGVLNVLGMIPGFGVAADLVNGFWYLSEGEWFEAASSFVSAVPGIGDIAGGIAKGITGCTKISKAIKFATRFASNIGNFALGAYSTATQIYGLWDKYVIKGQPWGDESLGEFLGAAFTGVTTVLSGKGVVDDIANYKNTKHDILTSQCFVEGTLVVTADGNKPIEEIQAGDLVYSTNPETGESEYKEVLRTFRKETDVLIHIFVNGEEIQTTPVHPFWVENQWVAAKDLEIGDILTLADGITATVTKTYGEQLDEPVIVYNFEVSDFHTYYVTDTGVLVHNANNTGGCVLKKSIPLAKPGEDLYVGTYSSSKYHNKKTGLNTTHTPHHAIADQITPTTHGKGITINMRKDLHEKTRTYKRATKVDPNNLRDNLAADVWDIRHILLEEKYDRHIVNAQLRELIKQNKKTYGLKKR